MDFLEITLRQQMFIGNSRTFEAPRAKREKRLKTNVNAPPQRPSKNHQKPLVFLMFACLVRPQSMKNNKFPLVIHAVSGDPLQVAENLGKTNVLNELGNASKKALKTQRKFVVFLPFRPKSIQLALIYKQFPGGPADSEKPFENQRQNAICIPMKSMLETITRPNKNRSKGCFCLRIRQHHYTK